MDDFVPVSVEIAGSFRTAPTVSSPSALTNKNNDLGLLTRMKTG